jgi:plasmid stabilization system protein ParE
MAKRAIVWTETAAKQRREILKYWTKRNHSSKYAKKLITLVHARLDLIAKNPKLYKITSYPDTRTSAMGHFSIYYKFNDKQIMVMAFWDNRQDPKKLLELLND